MNVVVGTDCAWLIDGSTDVEFSALLHLLVFLLVGNDCTKRDGGER